VTHTVLHIQAVSAVKPKICFVGAGRLHLRIPLFHLLQQQGFELAAIGPDVRDPSWNQTDFEYMQYPLNRSLNPFADRRSQQALTELLQQIKPDIVHAVNTKPCIMVPPAARAAGRAACVRTITGIGAVFSSRTPMALALRPVYRRLLRQSGRHVDATIFQNRDDREYFQRHKIGSIDEQIPIMSSGIDVDAFQQRVGEEAELQKLRTELGVTGKRVVTMITRLIKPKGVTEYLQAAARVRSRYPDVKFLLIGNIVGSGLQAIPIERIHQSAAHVLHLKSRSDIPNILAISDQFVLPSYFREGVPRVLLEAAALRVPLITTDAPGCRETVCNGWNGVLVPPRNSQALTDAILQLLQDPDLCATMGANGEQYMRNKFALSDVAEGYAQVYRSVLSSSGQCKYSTDIDSRAA